MSPPLGEREDEMKRTPEQWVFLGNRRLLETFIGFGLWFVFNTGMAFVTAFVMIALLNRNDSESRAVLDIVVKILFGINFLGNVVGLIVVAFIRRWVAFGMLLAFAAVLVAMTLFRGLTDAASCFMYLTGVTEITK